MKLMEIIILKNYRIIIFLEKIKPYCLPAVTVILVFFLIVSLLANVLLVKAETRLKKDIVGLKFQIVKMERISRSVNLENNKLLMGNNILKNKLKDKEEIIKNLNNDVSFIKNGIIQIIKRNIKTSNVKVKKECIMKPLNKVVKKSEEAKNKKFKKKRFALGFFKWFSKKKK